MKTSCSCAAVLCFPCTASTTLKGVLLLWKVSLRRRPAVSGLLKTALGRRGGTRVGPHFMGTRGAWWSIIKKHYAKTTGNAPYRLSTSTGAVENVDVASGFRKAPSFCCRVPPCCWCVSTVTTVLSNSSSMRSPTSCSQTRASFHYCSCLMKVWPYQLVLNWT